MTGIRKITKKTDNRFLNFYEMEAEARDGHVFPYYMASRNTSCEELAAVSGCVRPNGVNICAVINDGGEEKLVLINQYRYPAGCRVYELPAGLVEPGEDFREAAGRELFEETGLKLTPVTVPEGYDHPFLNSCGMSDEANSTVFGYASGEASTGHMESSEDIEVVLAGRKEAARILKSGQAALNCAYMLMFFVASENGKFFDFLKIPRA